jgi:hypothetical protein
VVSSPPFPLLGAASPPADIATHASPCYAFFPLSKTELTTPALSSGNASSRRLPSWVKTEALNSYHRSRPPSTDHLTPTLHCYKKIISTLATFFTTQSRLHFSSSLVRAPHHRSFTRHLRSLSLLLHAYHPFAQRHPRWRNNRLSFTFRITYQHVNSCKKIF